MPRLADLITSDRIVDLAATSKREALIELCDLLGTHPHITDPQRLRQAILERENVMSTGIGLGFAVPHAKIPEIRDYAIAVGRKKEGIEFGSLDGQPVRLVFMIGASDRQVSEFVKVLARVVRLLKDGDNRVALLDATLPDAFLDIIRRDDLKHR